MYAPKRFTIKDDTYMRVDEPLLRSVVEAIFISMGVPATDAARGADVLVSADLRGVESHGVSNMLRKYVRDYRNGKLNPVPAWKIVRETPATASIDGDRGLGIIIAPHAMNIAIEKARTTGVGFVTIRNAGHMGMVSYYPLMALEHDMIGGAMTATPPEVLPTFGAEPRLGTNPIACAAPAATLPPFVFDGATSVVSNNVLGLARRLGVQVPGGWIGDSEGVPMMHDVDPSPEGRSKAQLLPLGSTPECGSYKGYGLSCMVDIMSGILTGAGYSALPGRGDYSHAVYAYSIEAFMDPEEFKKTMDAWLTTLRTTKPARGQSRVYYAGEQEAEALSDRSVHGIPLHTEVLTWFGEITQELGIPNPLPSVT